MEQKKENGTGQICRFVKQLGQELWDDHQERKDQHEKEIYDEGFEAGNKFAIKTPLPHY